MNTDDEPNNNFKELIDSLNKALETEPEEAKDNETGMDDGKGGKIWYPLIDKFGKKHS